MSEQKYHEGDYVRIAKDLGKHMFHFTGDCNAIVLGSYKDLCGENGGVNTKSYSLHIEGKGSSSWYQEHQLTLIDNLTNLKG